MLWQRNEKNKGGGGGEGKCFIKKLEQNEVHDCEDDSYLWPLDLNQPPKMMRWYFFLTLFISSPHLSFMFFFLRPYTLLVFPFGPAHCLCLFSIALSYVLFLSQLNWKSYGGTTIVFVWEAIGLHKDRSVFSLSYTVSLCLVSWHFIVMPPSFTLSSSCHSPSLLPPHSSNTIPTCLPFRFSLSPSAAPCSALASMLMHQI